MKRLAISVELESGEKWTVQSKTVDYLLWETTAKKHKWGGIGDNPALWEAFIGWAASRRLGHYAGTWEQWQKDIDMVDAEQIEADPTPPEVGGEPS